MKEETIEEVMTTLDESVPQSVGRVYDLVMRRHSEALNHKLVRDWIATHTRQIYWWKLAGEPR